MSQKFFKQTIADVPLDGKVVLVRADYNVPLHPDGTVADDLRIRASVPTIQALLERHCTVVIVSHLGRPEGRDVRLSLEPAAQRLAELLGSSVRFVDQTVGDKVRMAVKRAPRGSVTVLENLRFYAEEEANDAEFAASIARDTGARYFVQDGFGVVHRAHASTEAITHYIPSVAGVLLEREYTTITRAMSHPERPLVAVVGGAKIKDKITVLKRFVELADTVIIGGAMANTFLAYKGYDMAKSKQESDQTAVLDEIYTAARAKVGQENVDRLLVLPRDVAVATDMDNVGERREVKVDALGSDDIALDVGEDTMAGNRAIISEAATVIWNGTLGLTEQELFQKGSGDLAEAITSRPEITSIIGGGDTADFVQHWDARDGASFTHVSTGGGASLELMAGDKLPGIESLLDATR